ncbi:MAG: rhodanese-like domain-containing protein [Anaerolineales bacterium]|nr:rhodanese-like domain-containing protein [Anaerolineales bacterium]
MPAKSRSKHRSSAARKSTARSTPTRAGSRISSSRSSSSLSRTSFLGRGRRGGVGVGGLLVLLLVIAVVAVIYFVNRPTSEAASVAAGVEITPAVAYQKLQQGAFLLDVREQSEWDAGRIPGTTHIPLGELSSRLDEVPREQEVVVVCNSGNRSQEGRDILLQNGFTNVSSMSGGVLDWGNAGYPFEGTIP